LGVNDRFTVQVGDVTKKIFSPGERFSAIVSNPPYITLDEMKDLAPELAYEPRAALTDEGDGLSVIRGVLDTAACHLEEGGLLLMEFGAEQGTAVSLLAREYSFYDVHILKDAAGHDRVLCGRCGRS
jgi:release factor glutamine methyltransferase